MKSNVDNDGIDGMFRMEETYGSVWHGDMAFFLNTIFNM